MRYLLDTHLVLWAAATPERLSDSALAVIDDPDQDLMFSAAVIWECAIKAEKNRADFDVDVRALRRSLLENGYSELAISSAHASAVADLPNHHGDPFDRIQIAQAHVEGVAFLTSDGLLARYGKPVETV